MKKKTVVIFILLALLIMGARSIVTLIDLEGTRVDPGQLHTTRTTWTVIDSTPGTVSALADLAVTERYYQAVKAAIAAAANDDDEISIFDIPRSWNGIRIRGIGITDDQAFTYQIYLGTLGDGNKDSDTTSADTELAYLGQLAFTVGTQESSISQVAYTGGGTNPIVANTLIVGDTSTSTATITAITASRSRTIMTNNIVNRILLPVALRSMTVVSSLVGVSSAISSAFQSTG